MQKGHQQRSWLRDQSNNYAPSLFREIRIYVKYLRNKIEGTSTDADDTVFMS